MARTLIRNISAQAQTLPAIYGSFLVAVGHGRVVSDETSVVVGELGGFADMDGKWNVFPVSTDTMLGDFDVEANGLSMLAEFVSEGITPPPATWADLSGKPTFATVATSGSYEDLADKPVLADVATSGSYADLSATPTIPSASNATPVDVGATAAAGVQAGFARADHQHAHGSLAGGSLHSTATTIAAGFMSAADKVKVDGLANVATSGAYADLSGKPTLANVATSGAYADLSSRTYDISSYASGTHAQNTILAQLLAPRNLTLTGLNQTGGATVKVQVAGVDVASFPKSVTSGQLVAVVVSVAGTNATFTITAVEA